MFFNVAAASFKGVQRQICLGVCCAFGAGRNGQNGLFSQVSASRKCSYAKKPVLPPFLLV